MTTNDLDMTTCDKCAKECEFKTLIYNKDDRYEFVCEQCDTTFREEAPKEQYDDMGVLCRYVNDEWFAIEDHCVTCGYRCDECECDEDEEEWVYPCWVCGTHKKEVKCSVCLEK